MTPVFSPQLLGQTEKALNGLLRRELTGTGVNEPQWVALTLTATGDGALDSRQLTGRVAGGLQVDESQAVEHLRALVAAGLVSDDDLPVLTVAGRELWSRVRAFTVAITQQLWGDLSPEDLDAAARVLATALARAGELLAEV